MSVPSPTAFELGSERDRVFFEAHPDRSYRIRAALEGEFPEVSAPRGAWILIAVRQLMPGVRARVPFTSNAYAPAGEDDARELYASLTAGWTAAKRIDAIAAELAKRGRA